MSQPNQRARDTRSARGSDSERKLEPEKQRIELLLERDGHEATIAWVRRTLQAYREAVDNPGSHASLPSYRPIFADSIEAMEYWLTQNAT